MKITLHGGEYDGRTLNRPTFAQDGSCLIVAERVKGDATFSAYRLAGGDATYIATNQFPVSGFYIATTMLNERVPPVLKPDLSKWEVGHVVRGFLTQPKQFGKRADLERQAAIYTEGMGYDHDTGEFLSKEAFERRAAENDITASTSAHRAIEEFLSPTTPPDLDWREYLIDEPLEGDA